MFGLFAAVAAAARMAFVLPAAARREPALRPPRRRAANLLGGRCAGIIVFGSLMGAMYIGQQFLQNVLGYSTVGRGRRDPARRVLHGARRTTVGQARRAQRRPQTLLCGYVFVLLGFLTMLLLWKEDISYWKVGLGYAFVGIGVGFAGTPASHSLTGSVPVKRVGMASGTADLQRDLGGAIMQSIFGALPDRRLRGGRGRRRSPLPASSVSTASRAS